MTYYGIKLYDAQDIMDRLKIGKSKAYEILHMFGMRGQLYRIGRHLRVEESTFNKWLKYECKR